LVGGNDDVTLLSEQVFTALLPSAAI
jgi:hypothetical protein